MKNFKKYLFKTIFIFIILSVFTLIWGVNSVSARDLNSASLNEALSIMIGRINELQELFDQLESSLTEASRAAGGAVLKLSPATGTFSVGSRFRVDILLNTNNNNIDGVDILYLNYDPSLLKVIDADSTMPGTQIGVGSLMPLTLANNVDTAQGKIFFSQVVLGGTSFNNNTDQVLATVEFEALNAGTASVWFDFTLGSTSDTNVAGGSKDILSGVTNGTYTIGTVVVDTTPPVRSNGLPQGSLSSGTTQTTISLQTDENATCKYSTSPNTPYTSMQNTFSTTGTKVHSTTVSGLQDGNTYIYYVRCKDANNNINNDDFQISFSVNSPAFDYTLSASGDIALTQGESGSNTIDIKLVSGETQPVSLSVAGLPADTISLFTPSALCSPDCSANLMISTNATTPPGSYTITVNANSGSISKSAVFSLIVNKAPSTKFKINDKIRTTDVVNVRQASGLSGPMLGVQTAGSVGTIIDGPQFADGMWWWKIDYVNGVDGWSAEEFLELFKNRKPVVSRIQTNVPDRDLTEGIQVFEGSTVTYSAIAFDPDDDPLSWKWSYTADEKTVEVSSGTGKVLPVEFTYPKGSAGREYKWRLEVSDGFDTVKQSLKVKVQKAFSSKSAILFISPSFDTHKVGDTFAVDVVIDTHGSEIDGVDIVSLHYNPERLQVQDDDPNTPGVQIEDKKLMPLTMINRVDTTAGKIEFSQIPVGGTRFTSTGPQVLATIHFKALKHGSTELKFDFDEKETRDTNITAGGIDILHSVGNAEYILEPTGSVDTPEEFKIKIKVELEGRKGKKDHKVPVALMIINPRTTAKLFEKSNLKGDFGRIEIQNVSFVPGFYDLKINVPGYLKIKLPNVFLPSDLELEFKDVPAGDLDGNNLINSLDRSILKAKWRKGDIEADFNEDGIVNVLDWGLMNKNWSREGDD